MPQSWIDTTNWSLQYFTFQPFTLRAPHWPKFALLWDASALRCGCDLQHRQKHWTQTASPRGGRVHYSHDMNKHLVDLSVLRVCSNSSGAQNVKVGPTLQASLTSLCETGPRTSPLLLWFVQNQGQQQTVRPQRHSCWRASGVGQVLGCWRGFPTLLDDSTNSRGRLRLHILICCPHCLCVSVDLLDTSRWFLKRRTINTPREGRGRGTHQNVDIYRYIRALTYLNNVRHDTQKRLPYTFWFGWWISWCGCCGDSLIWTSASRSRTPWHQWVKGSRF